MSGKKNKSKVYFQTKSNLNKKRNQRENTTKNSLAEKILQEEIELYKKEKEAQQKAIIDRINYKQKLINTLKIVIIINSILFIIAIIAMMSITGQNILELKENTIKGYLSVVNFAFLNLFLDTGISFILTAFRKVEKIYKKKSIKLGIQIIVCTLLLGIIFSGVFK